ncbi:hypothetical protein IAT40_005381 [Kwoniella sp. CBS 6097]
MAGSVGLKSGSSLPSESKCRVLEGELLHVLTAVHDEKEHIHLLKEYLRVVAGGVGLAFQVQPPGGSD